MKLQIEELYGILPLLKPFAGQETSATTQWRVSKLLRAMITEFKPAEEERVRLVSKYGEKDEKGVLVKDQDGNTAIADEEGFMGEWTELLGQEVEIAHPGLKDKDIEAIVEVLEKLGKKISIAHVNLLERLIEAKSDTPKDGG